MSVGGLSTFSWYFNSTFDWEKSTPNSLSTKIKCPIYNLHFQLRRAHGYHHCPLILGNFPLFKHSTQQFQVLTLLASKSLSISLLCIWKPPFICFIAAKTNSITSIDYFFFQYYLIILFREHYHLRDSQLDDYRFK